MGSVSQFQEVTPYGSIGLLAHDHLEGEKFYDLKVNDPLRIIYSDGTGQDYIISQTMLVGEKYDWNKLFYQVYVGDKLVLQTCYGQNGGRLFVIAYKKE